jgi:hypothetical protein
VENELQRLRIFLNAHRDSLPFFISVISEITVIVKS